MKELKEPLQLAEQGDAQAQCELGFRYAHGYGVSRDDQEAAKWYRQAAEQGEADAQHALGVMYDKGQGVPKDFQEAARWYRLAADQGHAKAQTVLGHKYAQGQGVAQNDQEAFRWVRKAAEQGYATAEAVLGSMYYEGRSGAPQDYVLAHMWFSLAASRYPPGPDRDFAAKHRDFAATKLTPAQIAEAQRLAREWMEKHGKKRRGK